MAKIYDSYVAMSSFLKDKFIENGMDEKSAEKKEIENARYISMTEQQ